MTSRVMVVIKDFMFVSTTRLHIRKWWFLPSLALHTHRSVRQAQRAAGFVGGQLSPEPLFGFWTVTVWTDEQTMRKFRNTAEHLKAMPRLLHWCDEASYAHWQQDDSAVPTATVVFERLRDTGKLSKVRHPSPAHVSGRTTRDTEPKAGQILRPLGT